MKITTLKEVKDLFPLGSFGSYRMAIHPEDYENDLVLLIEEDCTIENLDLDDVPATFSIVKKHEWISIILCLGNFTAQNIYNRNTDGSCNLTVLGNLSSTIILVGGQQLYVEKDLIVKDCFWGDYNHGMLSVCGKIKANVFLLTDGYNCNEFDFKFEANHCITDEEEYKKGDEFARTTVEYMFKEALLFKEDDLMDLVNGWKDWINREACIDYLESNIPILKEVFAAVEKPIVTYERFFITPPDYIQTQEELDRQIFNYEKLLEVANLEPDSELEFVKYGFKFTFFKEYDNNPNIAVLVAINDEFVLSISFEKSKKKTLFRKKTEASISGYVKERSKEEGVSIFEEAAPESYYDVFNDVWKMVLYHTERGAHFYKRFLNEAKASDIYTFCTLPIVTEFYNDWSDGAKNGFYNSFKKYSFRMPNKENGSAQLRISKEIKSDDGEYDCRAFRFVTDAIKNPKNVNLLYNYSQYEKIEGRYKEYNGTKVYLFDDELYEEALKWFDHAKSHIANENNYFLEDKQAYIDDNE